METLTEPQELRKKKRKEKKRNTWPLTLRLM
jgi:hypothetical protein